MMKYTVLKKQSLVYTVPSSQMTDHILSIWSAILPIFCQDETSVSSVGTLSFKLVQLTSKLKLLDSATLTKNERLAK